MVSKEPLKRRKSVKKKRNNLDKVSPIERQLKETETWTKDVIDLFSNLPTARERVAFIYDVLPDDATGLDRLWPVAIIQKDSRYANDFIVFIV